MKYITIIIGLIFSLNCFASLKLKDGQTYTDDYGIVHETLWGKVTAINIEYGNNGNNSCKYKIEFYVSQSAYQNDYLPIIELNYELVGGDWTTFALAIFQNQTDNIINYLEEWALTNTNLGIKVEQI
jgi:hypothetical protein